MACPTLNGRPLVRSDRSSAQTVEPRGYRRTLDDATNVFLQAATSPKVMFPKGRCADSEASTVCSGLTSIGGGDGFYADGASPHASIRLPCQRSFAGTSEINLRTVRCLNAFRLETPGHRMMTHRCNLLSPRSDGSGQVTQSHCTSDGRNAETKNAIELDGKRIEATYRIELNQTLTAVAEETLTIGGKSIDMTAGQVFLIDLTAETPTYQQKKVELLAIPSKLESTQDVEQLAEAIRKSLESQEPAIKEFLR